MLKKKVEELILAAIKSEQESKEVYEALASKVTNAFLKGRLEFLAKEEVKHKAWLEGLFKREFPGKAIKMPKETPVPLPLVIIEEGSVHVSEIMEKAMGAEKAAHDFYMSMAGLFEDPRIKGKLEYLAKMELGHYRILEHEIESMKEFEDYIDEWPMMHLGP